MNHIDLLRDHFDNRSQKYDSLRSWVKDASLLSKVIEMLNIKPSISVLDIGSGSGAVLQALLEKYDQIEECVALDISALMLHNISNARIKTIVCDAHKMDFEDSVFDRVIMRQSLHYMDDIDQVLSECRRVMKPSGSLVIAQITPFGKSDEEHWAKIAHCRQPLRKHCVTLHSMSNSLLKSGFKIVKTEQIRWRTTLRSWLARYEINESDATELWNLFYKAPLEYKYLHSMEIIENDILYDNCWSYIKAIKR